MTVSRRGQAIVEYLIVAIAVIAALLVLRTQIRPAMDTVYDAAKTKVDQATGSMSGAQMTGGRVWN